MPADSVGWSTLLGMGAAVAGAIVAGLGLGWLVDSLTGTAPVFLLVGLLLGVVGAVCYAILQFRTYLKT